MKVAHDDGVITESYSLDAPHVRAYYPDLTYSRVHMPSRDVLEAFKEMFKSNEKQFPSNAYLHIMRNAEEAIRMHNCMLYGVETSITARYCGTGFKMLNVHYFVWRGIVR